MSSMTAVLLTASLLVHPIDVTRLSVAEVVLLADLENPAQN